MTFGYALVELGIRVNILDNMGAERNNMIEADDTQFVRAEEESGTDLPVDLWGEILSFLSTKNIVAFACTSTSNRAIVQSLPHLFRFIDITSQAISDHSMERLISLSQGRCESFLLRNISLLTASGLAALEMQLSLSEVSVVGCKDITDEELFVGFLPPSVRKLSVVESGVATPLMIACAFVEEESTGIDIDIEIDIFECEKCLEAIPMDDQNICAECLDGICFTCCSVCNCCDELYCEACCDEIGMMNCDRCGYICCGNCEAAGSNHVSMCESCDSFLCDNCDEESRFCDVCFSFCCGECADTLTSYCDCCGHTACHGCDDEFRHCGDCGTSACGACIKKNGGLHNNQTRMIIIPFQMI